MDTVDWVVLCVIIACIAGITEHRFNQFECGIREIDAKQTCEILLNRSEENPAVRNQEIATCLASKGFTDGLNACGIK